MVAAWARSGILPAIERSAGSVAVSATRNSLRGMRLITVSLQGGRQVQRQSSSAPIVTGVSQALIHRGVEAGVLLDEDLAEVPVLVEQDGLEAHQFKKR